MFGLKKYNKKFSIIMPAFNEESRIKKMLDSLLSQSYKDFEIIVVDDGSTDKTYEICKEYQEKDGRVKVYKQDNCGCDCARNLALAHTNGEVLLFADGDDYYEKKALEKIEKTMSERELDVLNYNAKCFYDDIEEKDTILKKDRYLKKEKYPEVYDGYAYFKEQRNNGDYSSVVWSYAVKSRIIKKNHLRFMHVPKCRHGDVLFSFECLYHAKKVGFLSEQLYNRRVRSGSITNSKKDMRDVYSYYYIVSKLRHKYSKKMRDPEFSKFVLTVEKKAKDILGTLNNKEMRDGKKQFGFDKRFLKYVNTL